MMKPLRRRHLQVWLALAIVLPAGIIIAWLSIPDQPAVKLLQAPIVEQLPVIRNTNDLHNYTVNLRSNENNSLWQLEWKNKLPLTFPSAVIYKLNNPGDNISQAELIGRIEARGDYIFPISYDPTSHDQLNFILYDFIHEKIIDSINFKP